MISVIIPTYKNKEQLIKNLRHNLTYLEGCEVIIVNDYPQENLNKDLREFKEIILIQNAKNLGFGLTVNRGAGVAKNKYIMLLNSDVILSNARFKFPISSFEKNELLFAISFAQKEKGGKIVGKNKLFWKAGLMRHQKAADLNYGYNAWAEGGACLIDKDKFLRLGGFDQIYAPFYWEDIDLSYRAWKSGYEVIFDPNVIVEHHHESTIGKYFSSQTIKTISYRNQILFIWKNITDIKLLFSHLFFLFPNIIYFLIKREFSFSRGFFKALSKLNLVFQRRSSNKKTFIINDEKILKRFYE
ncbi:MAG: glycosyltransferase [Candidatus Roizmanbacteria bacterium]|nr:MAG: glycosyltransferase [Candidatus Roizmanbacteria bacterium]